MTMYEETIIKEAKRQKIVPGLLCPRCGHSHLKERLLTNAMSREAETILINGERLTIYVCDLCGTDEAIRQYHGQSKKLEDWSINWYE